MTSRLLMCMLSRKNTLTKILKFLFSFYLPFLITQSLENFSINLWAETFSNVQLEINKTIWPSISLKINCNENFLILRLLKIQIPCQCSLLQNNVCKHRIPSRNVVKVDVVSAYCQSGRCLNTDDTAMSST